MNANKISQKWEDFKDQTSRLSEKINRCGYLGYYELMKDYENEYKEAHRKMRAFAKRHNMMEDYEAWIS